MECRAQNLPAGSLCKSCSSLSLPGATPGPAFATYCKLPLHHLPSGPLSFLLPTFCRYLSLSNLRSTQCPGLPDWLEAAPQSFCPPASPDIPQHPATSRLSCTLLASTDDHPYLRAQYSFLGGTSGDARTLPASTHGVVSRVTESVCTERAPAACARGVVAVSGSSGSQRALTTSVPGVYDACSCTVVSLVFNVELRAWAEDVAQRIKRA